MLKQTAIVIAAVAFSAGLLTMKACEIAAPQPTKMQEFDKKLEMQAEQIKNLQEENGRITDRICDSNLRTK